RPLARPAAAGRRQRLLRDCARDPLLRPAGARRRPVDDRRRRHRLPAGRAGVDRPRPVERPPRRGGGRRVTRARVRSTVAVPVLAVLGGLLVWSLTGVDRFGRFAGAYGHLLNRVAVPQRHTTNVVSSVVFDYRGIDTMGEELILFAAVSGVVMLLRGSRAGEAEEEDKAHAVDRVTSDALNLLGVLLAGAALLL